MSLELTGLSYADWEAETSAIEQAWRRAESTRLVDAAHLARIYALDAAILDELVVIEDLSTLSDSSAVLAIEPVLHKLKSIRKRLQQVASRIGDMAGYARLALPLSHG